MPARFSSHVPLSPQFKVPSLPSGVSPTEPGPHFLRSLLFRQIPCDSEEVSSVISGPSQEMKVDTPASLICGLVASLHLLLAIGAVPVGEELGSDPPCQDYKLDRLLRAVEDKDNRTSFPVAVRYNLLFVVPEQQQQLENQIRLFQFQTCNIMGFEQGQSRNYGGSMGAPIQYWGRVVAGSSCVQATSDGLFILSPCDENRIQQWFRLSSSVDGEVVDYFPFRNQTMSYQYVGQTPYHIGWAQGQVASPLSYSINETFQLLEFPPA